ncbi:FAD/NAD(P)-binding domain-containing protein [Penicillium sp. IBT 35674x]|nr:FAD/NAD(P)-binding domain-containing protein [Penicillium sp. IBT 35674x]
MSSREHSSAHQGITNGTIIPEYRYPSSSYRILDQYHSQPSKVRVACAGAGASGLCLAYKMNKMLEPGSWELTLFEKNPHFGGTWWENTYPGVACDIPSHLYSFSWEPNANWSHYFAYGPEIQEYFEYFAKKHDLEKYIQLNTKLIEARWDGNDGIWNLTLENQVTKQITFDWAHALVNGTGILNTWKWPDIHGLDTFAGPLIHSAKWDHSVVMTGKTVGVIGVGSTAVQIVPELQKVAKELQVYMRSPTWISPPFGATALSKLQQGQPVNPGSRQYQFTVADKKRFHDDPQFYLRFRKEIEAEINTLFPMYIQNSNISKQFRKLITNEMLQRMGPGHEELKKFIVPIFSPGCRRISPADGFLEALVMDNVRPITKGITKVTPKGIVTEDGVEHPMEVLVINGTGKSIREDWTNGPNLYLGVSAPRFPNYYTIVGPGATWSNGTLLPGIETTVEYSIKMIRKMQTEGIKSLAVKQEAVDDIYAHFDEFHKTTVWKEACRSWFKDGKIRNRIYLWPGPTVHFLKTIKEPRFEDYDATYRYENRFAFLGNGTVKACITQDVEGLSPYVRDSDHEWSID